MYIPAPKPAAAALRASSALSPGMLVAESRVKERYLVMRLPGIGVSIFGGSKRFTPRGRPNASLPVAPSL
jgi:hypothetical protein